MDSAPKGRGCVIVHEAGDGKERGLLAEGDDGGLAAPLRRNGTGRGHGLFSSLGLINTIEEASSRMMRRVIDNSDMVCSYELVEEEYISSFLLSAQAF